jgi:hypothetical protein
MNEPDEPKKPVETRPKTVTGFDAPWYTERPKHSLLYRFLGLETAHSILKWRGPKKPPGPKLAAFYFVVIGSVGGYIYDRAQAKKLKQSYIDQVRWMSQQPIAWSDEQQQRIDVYAARVPEDSEPDRPIVFFKKYVKASQFPDLYSLLILHDSPYYTQQASITPLRTVRSQDQSAAFLQPSSSCTGWKKPPPCPRLQRNPLHPALRWSGETH